METVCVQSIFLTPGQEAKLGGIPVHSDSGGPAIEKLEAKLSFPYYPDQEKYFDISAPTEKIKDSKSLLCL